MLHECLVSLPHEDFLYLGDTARFPYGDRSAGPSCSGSRASSRASCSTAARSCSSWPATRPRRPRCRALREELGGRLPVVGVVTPESRLAAAATVNGRVGLIATPPRSASGAYARALAEAAPGRRAARGRLRRARAPDPGGRRGRRARRRLRRRPLPPAAGGRRRHRDPRLHPLPAGAPGAPAALGRGVSIVTSGEAIASEVEARLREAGVAQDDGRRGRYRFLATGDPEEFRRRHPLPPASDRRTWRRRAR